MSDPAMLVEDLCRQLGISALTDGAAADRLRAALADREQLLVLDNLEKVAVASPVVASLVRSCPGLSVLVTSRRSLRVDGERIVVVCALPIADDDTAVDSPAVGLYYDRASPVDADFELSDENMSAMVSICGRLDGLLLAIELAVARLRAIPPRELLARLSGSRPPVGGAEPSTRQHGGGVLSEVVGWSLDQLSPLELTVFARLGAFRGMWTIDAAESVGADGPPAGGMVDEAAVLDVIGALVDVHLVEPIHAVDGQRLGSSNTIADVARDRLAESGEE